MFSGTWILRCGKKGTGSEWLGESLDGWKAMEHTSSFSVPTPTRRGTTSTDGWIHTLWAQACCNLKTRSSGLKIAAPAELRVSRCHHIPGLGTAPVQEVLQGSKHVFSSISRCCIFTYIASSYVMDACTTFCCGCSAQGVRRGGKHLNTRRAVAGCHDRRERYWYLGGPGSPQDLSE